MKFTHLIEVEAPVSPEDFETVQVCLNLRGSKGHPAWYDKLHGWQPPEHDELELLSIEIQDPTTKLFRRAIPYCYPDSFDQPIIDAVDLWWCDHADECWESAE
jgi:hypothetical protein